MTVYLAGPIDYVSKDADVRLLAWRGRVKQLMPNLPMYDPAGAYAGDPLRDVDHLKTTNTAALLASTVVLAAVFPSQPSWGTPMEIAMAIEARIPVVLFNPTGLDAPPYMRDLPTHDLLVHAVQQVSEVWAVCNQVKEDGLASRSAVADAKHPILFSGGGIDAPKMEGDVGYDLRCLMTVTVSPLVGPVTQIWETMRTAAGWREAATRITRIIANHGAGGHGWTKVELGGIDNLKIASPPGTWFTLLPRSGISMKGILMPTAVIDTGYRGPLFAFVANLTREPIVLEKGQRIAQAVFFNSVVRPTRQMETLPVSKRGANGFGSTGA